MSGRARLGVVVLGVRSPARPGSPSAPRPGAGGLPGSYESAAAAAAEAAVSCCCCCCCSLSLANAACHNGFCE